MYDFGRFGVVRGMQYPPAEMREDLEKKAASAAPSPNFASPSETTLERRRAFADEEVPSRAARLDADGRYDLSWDGVSGGCGTDEGY